MSFPFLQITSFPNYELAQKVNFLCILNLMLTSTLSRQKDLVCFNIPHFVHRYFSVEFNIKILLQVLTFNLQIF